MMARIAAVSFGLTVAIALILAQQRAGVANPYYVPIYRHLILFQDFYAVLPFGAILLLALVPQARAAGEKLALACGRHPWRVAALALLALAAGTRWVYHGTALSMDEYAALFQAKVFAEGKLTAALPPALLDWLFPQWMEQFFRVDRASGAVVSGYWPGFSLLLAPFAKLGLPWLLNPLLGAATLLVVHRLALELLGDEKSAGCALLLTLASPAVTVNAISYYSMPAHLLANGIYALLLLRPAPARAFGAGLVGSLALVLHNPAPHALFALPWVAWLALRPGPGRAPVLGALFAGYAPLCLLLGLGWPRFIDHLGAAATLATLSTPSGASNLVLQRLSGVVNWPPEPELVAAQLGALAKLWLWSAPALVVLAAVGAWRLRTERGPWRALILSALLTYFGYFLIRFSQGHGWGARYFHSAWLVLPLLAVAALKRAPQEARADPLPGYLAACAALSLVVLTSFRALQVEQFVSRHLAQMPSASSGSARVLIVNPAGGYYAWDLPQNDPLLREPVRMTSVNAIRDAAMMAERFPQYRLLGSDRRGSVWGVP